MKTNTNNLAFIVEDDEMFSKMLNHTLSNGSAYQFKSFKNGEECINNLYMNPFMIIMDYGLPGMDGLKTLRIIKKYNRDIPVVVLTSVKDEKIAKEFLNEGAHTFLVKQKSSSPEIMNIVNTLLNNRIRDAIYPKSNGRTGISMSLLVVFFTIVIAMVALYLINQ